MSKFFIRRPIVAIVIAILIVLVGTISLVNLPTAQYPDIVPPEILVQTSFPGADAKTLTQAVATPLEQQMNGVDNMAYMYSVNANNGQTSLYVDFDVKTNPDTDQMLSQLRVDQAQAQLPAQVINSGITVQKSLISPLMLLTLSSPNNQYDEKFLTNYSIIKLQDEIARVPGVSRVQVFGGQYALRVWIKPEQLAKLGVTASDVIAALRTQNNINPAGQIGGQPVPNGQQFTYTVQTDGRLVDPEEFGKIVLRANPDGSTLYLRDVARIELGQQTYSMNSRYNGAPAGQLGIYQLPGSNAVETAKRVRVRLAELEKDLPAGVKCDVALDTTKAVSAGIHEILWTLGISLLLVVIVVYIFLQGWRATLIPLMAVPVSLIGTFIFFPMLGFSINTLSLFGLVLAIGLVVDDAIVVVEAVEHHIEEGMSPRNATYKAMEEVSGPVVAIALILAAVFIPTAAIPGITGRMYQQFAVTIAISVMISAFNALTLSPALAALLLRPRVASFKKGWVGGFFKRFNWLFHRTTNKYVSTAAIMMRRSGITLVVLGVMALMAVLLGHHLPTGFVPEEDQGYLYGGLQLTDASSLQRTDEVALEVTHKLKAIPGVKDVVQVNGFNLLTQTQSTNTAFFFIMLEPWEDRKDAQTQVSAILANATRSFGEVKNGLAFVFPPPAIPGIGTSGGVTMLLQDRSGNDSPEFLSQNLVTYLDALKKRPEIAAAVPAYLPAVPQLFAKVNREKAAQQQVKLDDVYSTLSTFMGGYLVNYFNRFGRQWQTYVEADGSSRTNINNIGQFYVRSANGGQVPLSTLVDTKQITGPEFIMRFNEYNAAQLNVTGAPGYSSGQVRKALEETFAQVMPQGMGYSYQGMSYQEKKAEQGVPTWMVFGISLLCVFLILAALYESWSLPFSVLLSTPVAILGAYLALSMRSLENDIFATIGLIMLIGLSAKNAILIVEFAVANYKRGLSISESALQASRLRFRPIVMTALAFVVGCLPLWTATGAGSSSRRILGTVVIGGMVLATLIGILMVPVTFAVVESLSLRFGRHTTHSDANFEPVAIEDNDEVDA